MKMICYFSALASALWTATASMAADLPQPNGTVILTVVGNIAYSNVDGEAHFDRAMLEGLGITQIKTATPWHDGTVTFEGVLFKTLIDHVGGQGDSVDALALNDYGTTIPMIDIQETGVILATKRNGQYMEVRDQGPIFVIYPYDSDPALQAQTYYARSAWQVTRLTVE